jgi:microcystin-dependent protein
MFSGDWSYSIPNDQQVVALGAEVIRDIKRDFRERIDSSFPPGSIHEWDTETAPDGYMECAGQSLAVATYPDVFSVIGYKFGGSGANFNLPNLCGLFVRCFPDGEFIDLDSYTHIETTGTIVADSAIITDIADTSNMKAGMDVSGSGIPDDTTIFSVDSATQITLSKDATADGDEIDLLFTHANIFCIGDVSGTAITSVINLLVCPRIGATIAGTGIPPNTTITELADFDDQGIPESMTISQSASTGTAVDLTIDNMIIGSVGYDSNKTHSHKYNRVELSGGNPPFVHASDKSGLSGGNEARPKNDATMFIIKLDESEATYSNAWNELIPEDDSLDGLSEAGKVDELIRQLKLDIRERILKHCPVGFRIKWTSDLIPPGFMECKGDSLVRVDHPVLFGIIGTTYGAADSSHFNLPDHRGYFARGWDHGRSDDFCDPDVATRTAVTIPGATMSAGDHVGTKQDDENEEHEHIYNTYGGLETPKGYVYLGGLGWIGRSFNVDIAAHGYTDITDKTGSENRPINKNIKYIIRVDGMDDNSGLFDETDDEYYKYIRNWDEASPLPSLRMGRIALELRKLKRDIEERIINFSPPGMVIYWPSDVLPDGYLKADGEAISRETYAELFDWIGDMYGPGDGITTFNKPDYRGWFLRAQDNGAGIDEGSRTDRGDGVTGDYVGTEEIDDVKEHDHTINDKAFVLGGSIIEGGTGKVTKIPTETQPSRTIDGRPKNMYLLALIKAVAI